MMTEEVKNKGYPNLHPQPQPPPPTFQRVATYPPPPPPATAAGYPPPAAGAYHPPPQPEYYPKPVSVSNKQRHASISGAHNPTIRKESVSPDVGEAIVETPCMRPPETHQSEALQECIDGTSSNSLTNDGSSGKGKNGRTETRGLKLVNQPTGLKRKVINSEGRILVTETFEAYPRTQIKVLWRLYATGPYAHWKDTPEEKKTTLWNAYKDLFEFNVPEDEAKQVMFAYCAQNYPNLMYQLRKKHFLPFKTLAEREKARPTNMELDDWKVLINYWSGEEFSKKCSTNKQNRAKNDLQHATGACPFALRRYRNEMEGKSNTPLDLWFQTHTKKDSTFVSKRAEEIYDKVKNKKEEATADGDTMYDENLGFREVYGPPKSGKVIGYGRGVKPSMVFPSVRGHATSEL